MNRSMPIPMLINEQSPFLSLEFFPPKNKEDWPAFLVAAQTLAALKPLFVSVTYGAGGSTQSNTLEICQRLMDCCKFTVMPHLTGVTATKEKINDFLDSIAAMGIRNVLALRGDRPAGCSDSDDQLFAAFPHAVDLIRHIRSHNPDMAIGVAGFPEAHSEAATINDDLTVMRDKMESGANFIVTQLYFDNRVYYDYVDRLQKRGVTLPVIPGILPIRSLSSLLFTLKLCNAKIPGKLMNSLFTAHAKGGNEAVYRVGIDYARAQVRDLLDRGVPGIHLYTLNRADMCIEVMKGLL